MMPVTQGLRLLLRLRHHSRLHGHVYGAGPGVRPAPGPDRHDHQEKEVGAIYVRRLVRGEVRKKKVRKKK